MTGYRGPGATLRGPVSSTDNAIARFDGATGKLVQNASGVTVDDNNRIISTGNEGTAGTGTTATEYGDGFHHVTRLAMAGVLPNIGSGVTLGLGLLVYTFPAGVILVDAVHMDVGITQSQGFINADTPEVGIGSVIAVGAVSALNGTSTFEDYVTGTSAGNCTGTKTDLTTETTAGGAVVIPASGGLAHTVHFNAADIWAANGDSGATLSGDVWIAWRFLGA